MSFQPLNTDNSDDLFGDKPWVEEYVNTNPKLNFSIVYHCKAIKITPKGYLLGTEVFMVWVWKKSSLGRTLAAVIDDLLKTDIYPTLAIKLSKKTKEKCSVGLLDDHFSRYITDQDGIIELHPDEIQTPIPVNPPVFPKQDEPSPKK